MPDAIVAELIRIYEMDKRELIPKAEVLELLARISTVVSMSEVLVDFGLDVKALAQSASLYPKVEFSNEKHEETT